MRTLFEIAPFRRPEFAPALGADWSWLTDMWTTGKDVYEAYTSVEKAEEERKAAEARAAAAAAQARAAQAQTAPAAPAGGGVGGIPTSYLIIGGLGLVAVAVIVAIAAK